MPTSPEVSVGAKPLFVVDFDHTLFTSNSTELFISRSSPALAAAVVDFLVKRTVPWRFLGIRHWVRCRDYWRCLAIAVLMPWNLWRWARAAPGEFATRESAAVRRTLVRAEARGARVVIASFGMGFVIRALLRDSRWRSAQIVATPTLLRPAYFQHGKLHHMVDALGAEVTADCVFITDSADDQDVLDHVRDGRIIEPQGRPFDASSRLYLPFRYTARAKYSRGYVFDQTLFVDLAILVIAYAKDLPSLMAAAAAMPFFVVSFSAVYEIGLYENDRAGARREARPSLKSNVGDFDDYPISLGGWVWGFASGALGVAVADALHLLEPATAAAALAKWVAILVSVRLLFFVYNRLRVGERTVLYPLLQVSKFLGPFLILAPLPVGGLLALSQVLTMSAVYLVYRSGGAPDRINKDGLRWILLLVFGLLLEVAGLLDLATASPLACSLALAWATLRLAKASLTTRYRSRAGGPDPLARGSQNGTPSGR